MTHDSPDKQRRRRRWVTSAMTMLVIVAVMICILLLLGYGPVERWIPPAVAMVVAWPSAQAMHASKNRQA